MAPLRTLLKRLCVTFLFSPVFLFLWFDVFIYEPVFQSIRLARSHPGGNSSINTCPDLSTMLKQASPLPPLSLTALLPLASASLVNFSTTLQSLFFSNSTCLSEIVIACPESILAEARVILRKHVLRMSVDHHHRDVDISLHAWNDRLEVDLLHIALHHTRTAYILILDETGLSGISKSDQRSLINAPLTIPYPLGPHGVLIGAYNTSIIQKADFPQRASYLVPPFVLPRRSLEGIRVSSSLGAWASLGKHVSNTNLEEIGGIIMPSRSVSPLMKVSAGVFLVLLGSSEDLGVFSPTLCRLADKGFDISILVVSSSNNHRRFLNFKASHGACSLVYHVTTVPDFLEISAPGLAPDIIIDASNVHHQVQRTFSSAALIRLPREDLAYCIWMSALTLRSWRHWNIPKIDISVITNDRPWSLRRLLQSLNTATYFGDRLNLRINLEQSSDEETIQTAMDFQWPHGSVFLHHRIIHGGLLPAVVESWYPNSNDSFGLLLEDDVEVSPMFYAWIKMSILEYRYCAQPATDRIFGISLYQQKHLELRMEGRQVFNANIAFDISTPATSPYLSPIPCSWGAVYFPEIWKEFHVFLAQRLSEETFPITQEIVPEVRSNRWTKSWKKFFIEMAFLRGYVMLYPNYPGFVSLSTNHLEVGSHVKQLTEKKKELFQLPLMESFSTLLELPNQALPNWQHLPVLNLTGYLSTMQWLKEFGYSRRRELSESYDVQDLF